MKQTGTSLSFRERVLIADDLRGRKAEVAEAVSAEFLRLHPDWVQRFGERARTKGIEDAIFHIDFLAAAIESGSPDSFSDYARWTARVLGARGIGPEFLAENLQQIAEAFGGTLTGSARTYFDLVVQSGRAACTTGPVNVEDPSSSLSGLARLYVDAILGAQKENATNLALEGIQASGSVLRVYSEIFQEAQYEIGRRWEANRISVAQEHLATVVTQYALGQVYSRIERRPPTRERVLITGVQGEMHQVGANIVADLFEAEGWDVRFLGTNLPGAHIVDAIATLKPQIVGISATMAFSLPAVRLLIDAIRERMTPVPKIILGGGAFRFAEGLWKEMGADGCAGDLLTALNLLNALSPHPPEAR